MVLLTVNWFRLIVGVPGNVTLSALYSTFREVLIQGSLTLQLVIGSLLISLLFLAFYFASLQSKKNFEETYVLLSRMNQRLKQLENKKDT